MQAVFALAFLAAANAAIIDPSMYYKPEAKIYNPYYSQYMQNDYPYSMERLDDAIISAPVAESVISAANPAIAPVFAKTAAFPWANIHAKAAPVVPSNIALESAFAPALKSGLAYAIPAVKSSAYHLVKADYPYFTAAPTSSYVEAAAPVVTAEEYAARGLLPISSAIPSISSAFPAISSALPASLAGAEPALMKAFSPALINAASPFVASSVAAPSMSLFKSAAFPWGLVSSVAAPSAATISLMKSAPLLSTAESAFAPAAVHAINAAPIHLVKSAAPASLVSGLYSAENALTTPYSLVKTFSPASSLYEEPAIAFAPHVHAYAPALKAAFPSAMPALTAFAPSAFSSSVAAPAYGYGYLADSPALKAWIK